MTITITITSPGRPQLEMSEEVQQCVDIFNSYRKFFQELHHKTFIFCWEKEKHSKSDQAVCFGLEEEEETGEEELR